MSTVLITGTNSGIGLEFVKQYAQEQYRVFACYLPSGTLQELELVKKQYPAVNLIPLDVTNENQIERVAQQLKGETIDILINNAGIADGDQDLTTVTADEMINVFTVNAVGPLLVTKHFIGHVAASDLKTIVSITSRMGSISFILKNGQNYADNFAYCASKAALNSIMARIAVKTFDQGLKFLLLHPGHVATQLGLKIAQDAAIDIATSVAGMRTVIERAPRSLDQLFYNYEGKPMAW